MTTIKKIIERVDRKIVNGYTDETKLEWISALDGKIAMDVMLMDISEISRFNYSFPEDLSTQPLVQFPYDDLYDKWIAAQIAAMDEEWDRYANLMELYNAFYEEFVNWFLSTYKPGQGCMGDGGYRPQIPSYYITAYGLAQMKGFAGSLEDWFESLRGEKGDKGDPYGVLQIGTVESVESGGRAYATITGTPANPLLNLGIPRQMGEFLPVGGGRMKGPINGLTLPEADDQAACKGYADSVGLSYRGTTDEIDTERSDLAQGAYQVTTEIYGVTAGVLLQWQFIPGIMGMQWLISDGADRMWLRICWDGVQQKWRQLGFDYGEALPENAQDGQLYLLKV